MGILKFGSVCEMPLKPVVLTFLCISLVYDLYNVYTFFHSATFLEGMFNAMDYYYQKENLQIILYVKYAISYIVIVDALDATAIFLYLYGMWKKMALLMIPLLVINCVTLTLLLFISVFLIVYMLQIPDFDDVYSFILIVFTLVIGLIWLVYVNILFPYNYYRQSKALWNANNKLMI